MKCLCRRNIASIGDLVSKVFAAVLSSSPQVTSRLMGLWVVCTGVSATVVPNQSFNWPIEQFFRGRRQRVEGVIH